VERYEHEFDATIPALFGGTRFATPRTYTAELGFHF
jgi:hypothetical protein